MLMEQIHLVEMPYTKETMPTAHVQGVDVTSILHVDGSDPDHEKFSRTYNMPLYFLPPPCGEPSPLLSHDHVIENEP